MLEDPDILNMFLDKCCVFMGDFMNAEGTGKTIDAIMAEALDEFVAHRAKYQTWGGNSREEITNKFNDAKKWLAGYTEQGWWSTTTYLSRTDYFTQYLGAQFNLGDAIPVTVNKNITDMPDTVLVNSIKLSKGVFDGKLFPNRKYTINGVAPEGKVIKGWKVTITPSSGSKQTKEYEGSEFTMTLKKCKSVSIEAVLGETNGIQTIQTPDFTHQASPLYDLLGNKVNTPKAGRIYIQNGKKTLWK